MKVFAASSSTGRGQLLSQGIAAYMLMLGGTCLAYTMIRSFGLGLGAPAPLDVPPQLGTTAVPPLIDALPHVLIALAAVIGLARTFGWLFATIKQPLVIGEILAGILLGPSVLGRLAPQALALILPPEVAPFLSILSQLGIILFMFLVGLELDPALLKKRGHATLTISHASILMPFILGTLLALGIYPVLSTRDVSFTAFSLFMGVSMSVTAFPVLARILTDRQMHKTRLGTLALACAAVNDVTAWCLLAIVVGVVQAKAADGVRTAALALAYVLGVTLFVAPYMRRLVCYIDRRGELTQGVLAVIFLALLASSLTTNAIGIHAMFGGFALGVVIPHDSRLARELSRRLTDIVVVLFMPAFFALTGMRTQLSLVSGLSEWLLCAAIITVASLGKFGGSLVSARLTGLGWRESAALGVLLNTRGLMELIVLNIGLDLHIISPTLFAMLVLMALVTTFATTPILHFLLGDSRGVYESRPHCSDGDGSLSTCSRA